MQQTKGALFGAGGVFLVFAALAWQLPRLLDTQGAASLVLRLGLLFFGAAGALLIILLMRSRAPSGTSGGDEIDNAFAAAQARLANARITSESRVARLPVALVLGPAGSAKSSTLTQSGLEPELLAGEVMRGDGVIPTDPVNIWYAHGTILVEAGGRLLEDADRWNRLVRQLRPSRLGAAIGRGRQPSRVAILCFPCDELTRPGASQQLASSARQLRERLSAVSQQLGIRLPVYVLFTRADRLPYFTDYVRSFSSQEAHEVVGATLPVHTDTSGVWAERESRRLNDAFSRMVHSLAMRRLDVLPRETQEDVRANAYEFPRELRKVTEPAVQLLLDIFRPTQLGMNPLLRGFYFTGVRPVIMRDVIPTAVAQRAGGGQPASGATMVFNPALAQQVQQAPATGNGGRKVPQWVFLQRFFRDVMLKDDVAARLTSGGARVDLLRRGLITAAAAVCLIFAFGLTYSWASNSAMIRRSRTAVEQALALGSLPGTAGDAELAKLDALREQTEQVERWNRAGPPLGLRWGLYAGTKVRNVLYPVYFERFDNLLWRDTRDRIVQYLRGLPRDPDANSDFVRTQDALAAYLLTTTENRRSTSEQLTPTLIRFWGGTQASDTLRSLAERQFDFYAAALADSNPYTFTRDDELVQNTQQFLRAFGPQAYYRALLAAANRAAEGRRYSGPGVLQNEYTVPGSFTLAGYRQMQASMDSVDIVFARFEWIYGRPPEQVKKDVLQQLYENDYVAQWQRYLSSGSISAFGSPADASGKLRVLSEQLNSPIVNMLAIASRETSMDSTSRITRAFQPLHATVPPEDPPGPASKLTDYLNQLGTLQSQLSLLDRSAGSRDAEGLRAAADAASDLVNRANSLSPGYNSAGEAMVTAREVQRLLKQPGEYALAVVRRAPAAAVDGAARAFCEGYSRLRGRYPFDPNGADASSRDVTAIFQKGEGDLWTFHKSALEPYFNAQGALITRDASVSQAFAAFFSRAVDFSNALFVERGGPRISFDFRPLTYTGITEVVLEVDGTPYRFTSTNRASQSIVWRPDRGLPVRLIVRSGNQEVHRIEGEGEWAIFRIFRGATWTEGNDWHRVEWTIPGRAEPFSAEIGLDVKPVLQPGYLRNLASCPGRVLN